MDTELMIGDFGAFANLVSTEAEETLTLEFKRKPSPGADLQRDDKKLLGEAVSGFANAAGGMLIIGISTTPYEGMDRASELIEIEDVETVAARYRSYIPQCTSPPVEGVEVRPVVSSAGRGVIAIHVPKGQARPHMSRAPGHHTYYRRVMYRFLPMEAYEVEEMMRIKSSPELSLITNLVRQGSIGENKEFALLFGLENISLTCAKFPYIEYLRTDDGPHVHEFGLDGNGNTLWPKALHASSKGALFTAGSNQVLHPGQSVFVSKIVMNEQPIRSGLWRWGLSSVPDNDVVKFIFDFGCEDCPKITREIEFSKEYLIDFVRPVN